MSGATELPPAESQRIWEVKNHTGELIACIDQSGNFWIKGHAEINLGDNMPTPVPGRSYWQRFDGLNRSAMIELFDPVSGQATGNMFVRGPVTPNTAPDAGAAFTVKNSAGTVVTSISDGGGIKTPGDSPTTDASLENPPCESVDIMWYMPVGIISNAPQSYGYLMCHSVNINGRDGDNATNLSYDPSYSNWSNYGVTAIRRSCYYLSPTPPPLPLPPIPIPTPEPYDYDMDTDRWDIEPFVHVGSNDVDWGLWQNWDPLEGPNKYKLFVTSVDNAVDGNDGEAYAEGTVNLVDLNLSVDSPYLIPFFFDENSVSVITATITPSEVAGGVEYRWMCMPNLEFLDDEGNPVESFDWSASRNSVNCRGNFYGNGDVYCQVRFKKFPWKTPVEYEYDDFVQHIWVFTAVEFEYNTFIKCNLLGAGSLASFPFHAGDDRNFQYQGGSNDRYRTHQRVVVTICPRYTNGKVGEEEEDCGVTHSYFANDINNPGDKSFQCDCPYILTQSADADCTGEQSADTLSITVMRQSEYRVNMDMNVESSNPCELGSPAIDVISELYIEQYWGLDQYGNPYMDNCDYWGTIDFDGFPWHELYINQYGGHLQYDPCANGKDPLALFGGPEENRSFSGQTY